jgi:hypothetical protein
MIDEMMSVLCVQVAGKEYVHEKTKITDIDTLCCDER